MGRVLITGSTGVVGSALIPCLLREQNHDLVLLIRASDSKALQERFETLLKYWRADSTWRRDQEDRLIPIIGDITLPRLGMDQSAVKALLPDLCRIVHAAANVKMNLSLQAARDISVSSVREILALADQAKPAVKIDYVSTMGVAGRMQGDIPETRLETRCDYHNTYEEAKAEAETLVFNAMDKGLQATIYRPSMITGDSQTGRTIHFQIFHHLSYFFSGAVSGGWLPRLSDVRLDLTPSDYVAEAIARAGSRRESYGKVLHLTSGSGHGTGVDELGERLRAALFRNGARLPKIRKIPLSVFRGGLAAAKPFLPGHVRRRMALLPIAFEYLQDKQDFVNDQSVPFLDSMGVNWPDPADYVDKSLEYFAEYGPGKKSK